MGHPLSIQLNELQIETCGSVAPPARFASATEFALYQYYLLDQKYRLPASELCPEVVRLEVFGLNDLKERLSNYIDPLWDNGPFVLAHTDLRWSNIIVDDDLNIQGIVDWEWAGTVPRQFFLPPTWIAGRPPDSVAGILYRVEYSCFYDTLKAKSVSSRPCHQLLEHWGHSLPRQVDLPIAVTLRHHSCFVNMYYRGIFPLFYKAHRSEIVDQFFERDGEDGPFTLEVQRRLAYSERYTRYLKDAGLFTKDKAPGTATSQSPTKQQEPRDVSDQSSHAAPRPGPAAGDPTHVSHNLPDPSSPSQDSSTLPPHHISLNEVR